MVTRRCRVSPFVSSPFVADVIVIVASEQVLFVIVICNWWHVSVACHQLVTRRCRVSPSDMNHVTVMYSAHRDIVTSWLVTCLYRVKYLFYDG